MLSICQFDNLVTLPTLSTLSICQLVNFVNFFFFPKEANFFFWGWVDHIHHHTCSRVDHHYLTHSHSINKELDQYLMAYIHVGWVSLYIEMGAAADITHYFLPCHLLILTPWLLRFRTVVSMQWTRSLINTSLHKFTLDGCLYK